MAGHFKTLSITHQFFEVPKYLVNSHLCFSDSGIPSSLLIKITVLLWVFVIVVVVFFLFVCVLGFFGCVFLFCFGAFKRVLEAHLGVVKQELQPGVQAALADFPSPTQHKV